MPTATHAAGHPAGSPARRRARRSPCCGGSRHRLRSGAGRPVHRPTRMTTGRRCRGAADADPRGSSEKGCRPADIAGVAREEQTLYDIAQALGSTRFADSMAHTDKVTGWCRLTFACSGRLRGRLRLPLALDPAPTLLKWEPGRGASGAAPAACRRRPRGAGESGPRCCPARLVQGRRSAAS